MMKQKYCDTMTLYSLNMYSLVYSHVVSNASNLSGGEGGRGFTQNRNKYCNVA